MDKEQKILDKRWIHQKKQARYGDATAGFWSDALLQYSIDIGWGKVFEIHNFTGNNFLKNIERIIKTYSPYKPPRRKRDGGTDQEIKDHAALKGAKDGFLFRNTTIKHHPELLNIVLGTEWEGFFSSNWSEILLLKKAKRNLDYCEKLRVIPTDDEFNILNWMQSIKRYKIETQSKIKTMLLSYTFVGTEKFFNFSEDLGDLTKQMKTALELHVYVQKYGMPKVNRANPKSEEAKFYRFLQRITLAFRNNDLYGTTRLCPDVKEFMLKNGYLRPRIDAAKLQLQKAFELHKYIEKFGMPQNTGKTVTRESKKHYLFLYKARICFKNNDFSRGSRLFPETKKFLLKHGYLK